MPIRLPASPSPPRRADAARGALGAPAACPPLVVLYGPGAALDADTSASFVSKEQFVSGKL